MMEPMSLGSPVIGSPSSTSQTGNSHYLPGYLMDDVSSQVGGRPFQTSPIKLNKPATVGYLSTSPQHSTSTVTPKTLRMGKTDKPGGPPVQTLFAASVTSPATPRDYTPQINLGNVSTAGGDYSTCGADDADPGVWVTVYGFPPSAANFILTQAALWGHVLEHRIPAQGNWMHLKFASRLQARKALARNGRLLTDTLMIGVAPCSDPTLVEEVSRKENVPMSSTPSVKVMAPSTPMASAWDRSAGSSSFALGHTSALGTPSALDRSRSSVRPLTQAYKGAQADYEVTQQRATPQQNTSLVSKAMEFVFGW